MILPKAAIMFGVSNRSDYSVRSMCFASKLARRRSSGEDGARPEDETLHDTPSLTATPMPQARPALATSERGEKPSVLVVDDEELVGTMLAVILKRFGCQTQVARTGAEAIESLRADENIALVLLDVRMPGLDGPQTLEVMRSIKPALHCCFMTGDIGKYTESELTSRGILSILSKPFRLDEIARVLGRAGIASAMPLAEVHPY